ncbi:MAG: TRAP transporter substrate-binding protein [Deltaproteobacteria bacterium]|nr:TRAP transporter substrate-binding protein [Deltaproteobacteria bacterium]
MEKNRVIAACMGIFLVLSLGAFYSIHAPAAVASEKPIELKFGYFQPLHCPNMDKGYHPWVKNIEKATRGKVKIVHYPSQSLFKAREAIRAVESGIADMVNTPLGYFTGRFNLTEVMFLPFLLKIPSSRVNSGIVWRLFEAVPEVQKEYSTMKVLTLCTTGPYFIASVKKPIRNQADLQGLKVRTIGKYPTKVMKGLGATPVMVPLPETYEAATKGVIDAGLILPAMIPDFRLHEVFNYWTDVTLWPSLVLTAMNLKKWNSLPPDVQKGIMSVCGLKGSQFIGGHAYGEGLKEDIDKAVRESKTRWERVELDKGELEKWKESVGNPIWKEWVKEMEDKGLPGQKVLDAAVEIVEKYSE